MQPGVFSVPPRQQRQKVRDSYSRVSRRKTRVLHTCKCKTCQGAALSESWGASGRRLPTIYGSITAS